MIRYLCPRCKQSLAARDGEAGAKVNCLSCGQKVQVPAPPPASKTMLGTLEEANAIPAVPRAVLVEKAPLPGGPEPLEVEAVDEPRPRGHAARDDEEDDRPSRRSRDDENDECDRRRRRPRSYRPCPRCGCRDYPRQVTKLGSASIALLIIGILFWPLIIVALLMQEKWEVCPDCGEQLRQTGTGF
jgi:hypothetical protein